jgi:hypothetical protein
MAQMLNSLRAVVVARKPTDEDDFPIDKLFIVAICCVLPVLGGSLLYYAWRKDHPVAARFANRTSWVVFFLAPVMVLALGYLSP